MYRVWKGVQPVVESHHSHQEAHRIQGGRISKHIPYPDTDAAAPPKSHQNDGRPRAYH